MAAAQDRQERYANKLRSPVPVYKKGNWVYLDLYNVKTARASKKLDWLHAKYRVLRQVNSHAYELDVEGRVHPVFHVDLLRPEASDPLPSQKTDNVRQGPIIMDDHEKYHIEEILDVQNKTKYGKN